MIESLFNRKCLDMLHASTVRDFSRQFVDFAQSLGFDTVGGAVITEHSPSMYEFQSFSNAPEGYRKEFANGPSGRIDAVNQHCKRSSKPIVWNRETYSSPAQQRLWALQAEFGYRSGIACALHLGRGRHYLFGANWSHDRCEHVSNYKAIFEDFLIFGAHSQAAAFELSAPTVRDAGIAGGLSKSEVEVLRWTMDGLSAWEVGRKMALSDYDVVLRLQRAMGKLRCGSKYEAVLKAIKLGLIETE